MRVERRLTQTDIAEALGVSKAAVSSWEVGRATPNLQQLKPMADALGVSCAELLGDDPPSAPAEIDPTRLAEALSLLERHGGRAFDQLTPDKKARLIAYVYAQQGPSTPKALAALIGLAR